MRRASISFLQIAQLAMARTLGFGNRRSALKPAWTEGCAPVRTPPEKDEIVK